MKPKTTMSVDEDGTILADVTDLTTIVDHIDEACGRNDALRAYTLAGDHPWPGAHPAPRSLSLTPDGRRHPERPSALPSSPLAPGRWV